MRVWKSTRHVSAPVVLVFVAAAALFALLPATGRGADSAAAPFVLPPGPAKPGFDAARLDFSMYGAFEPFVITSTRPAREALRAGLIAPDTDVLIATTTAGPLALLTEQMAYHHIAQGRTNGEDWLVSFCVVCNTATRLVPTVKGAVTRFVTAGVYDGMMVMRDEATGTLWNHLTGEALYGPGVGTTIGPAANVLHGTVKQLLASDADARVAISDRIYFAGGKRHGTREGISLLGRRHERPNARTGLSEVFVATLGAEDTRRPRMDLGLGIWWEGGSRYYPRDVIRQHGDAVIDRLNGRTVIVYIDPSTSTPAAMFVDSTRARVDGSRVKLDAGTVRDGVLLDSRGHAVAVERPQQVFTRWYGFALTFPATSIYSTPRLQ
jgi:hypothetical protein